MDDQSFARQVIPADNPGIDAIADQLGCFTRDELRTWRHPGPSPWFSEMEQKVNGTQYVHTLCAQAGTARCLFHRKLGHCSRPAAYWRHRFEATIKAIRCGCDSLVCPQCNTGGRPKAVCERCSLLTGWERDHAELLGRLLDKLIAAE